MIVIDIFKKKSIISSHVIDFVHGTKWAILVNWSTVTIIKSKKLKTRRFVIKSIDIKDYTYFRIDKDWRSW